MASKDKGRRETKKAKKVTKTTAPATLLPAAKPATSKPAASPGN